MLQQTQVKTVLPYWNRWMQHLPTLQALAHASSAKIHKLWEGLGYYHRARNMQKAARIVLKEHGGQIPSDVETLMTLPGVGRYTAGAISSIAFRQPSPIVDGNVARVLTRLFCIKEDTRERATTERLWGLAGELVLHAAMRGKRQRRQTHSKTTQSKSRNNSKSSCSILNQAMMELGALVCTPSAPRCHACPVSTVCAARKCGVAEQLPNSGRRLAVTAKRFVAFVVCDQDQYLVRQRSAGIVNAHLWEFPNAEANERESGPKALAQKMLRFEITDLKHFCTIKHSITRYRITLEVFRATSPRSRSRSVPGHWLTIPAMRRLPFSSAHKQILDRLQTTCQRTRSNPR